MRYVMIALLAAAGCGASLLMRDRVKPQMERYRKASQKLARKPALFVIVAPVLQKLGA